MKITILGSCRQDSLYSIYNVTSIKNNISYPHYTKEMLEVIKFCKFGHISPEKTIYTFRSAILNKKPIYFTPELKTEFEETDIYILEIASKITYMYDDIYLHHISSEDIYNTSIKNKIIQRVQTNEEIENDIITIKNMLNKPIIIVGHIVTYNKGERYNLLMLLEEICSKYNIPFINPVKEFNKMGYHIKDLIMNENVIAHYNNKGNELIRMIYTSYINNIMKNQQ